MADESERRAGARGAIDALRQLGKRGCVWRRRCFRERSEREAFQQGLRMIKLDNAARSREGGTQSNMRGPACLVWIPLSRDERKAFVPASQIMPRIGAIERLIAERKIRHDVAFDRGFQERHWNQDASRRCSGDAPSASSRSQTSTSPRKASVTARLRSAGRWARPRSGFAFGQ